MRRAGVTLQLLWSEYQAVTAERADGARPYQYSQFCDLYRVHGAQLSALATPSLTDSRHLCGR
jgi:hypothetical protein